MDLDKSQRNIDICVQRDIAGKCPLRHQTVVRRKRKRSEVTLVSLQDNISAVHAFKVRVLGKIPFSNWTKETTCPKLKPINLHNR